MAVLLVGAIVRWLGLCLIAVGLCMAAKRGDAELAPAARPRLRVAGDAARRAGSAGLPRRIAPSA